MLEHLEYLEPWWQPWRVLSAFCFLAVPLIAVLEHLEYLEPWRVLSACCFLAGPLIAVLEHLEYLEPWWQPWRVLSACCFLAGPLIAVLHHLLHPLDFWLSRDVPCADSVPLLGSFTGSLLHGRSFQDDLDALYARHKQRGVVGLFQWRTPCMLVCRPALVAHILEQTETVKSEEQAGQPLAMHEVPAAVRDRLSPLLLVGRVDAMARLMADCAAQLVQLLQDQAGGAGAELELVSPLSRFTADLVGACAFGVPCNCIRDPDSELHDVAVRARRPPLLSLVALAAVTSCRALAALLPPHLLYPAAASFYVDMLRETRGFRERTRTRRRDFVDLMMEAGSPQRHFLADKDRRRHVELVYDVVAAQSFVLDVAGEDSVVAVVAQCLHELAQQPALQQRVADEVLAVADVPTLEALQSTPLLDQVLLETLRMYPPCGVVVREVGADPLTLPGTAVTLPPRTRIYVNVLAMHRDPDLYPEPLLFKPGRFSPEQCADRAVASFLPFGEKVVTPVSWSGSIVPGHSTAARFAFQSMRLCLAALLKDLEFRLSPRTTPSTETSPQTELWLCVQCRPSEVHGSQ